MLDIQKELEKFNRLLEEVDDDAAGSADAEAPANSGENVSEDSHQNVSPDSYASERDVAVTAADSNGDNSPVTPVEASPIDSDAAVVPVSDAVLATINRDNGVDQRATARYSADREASLSEYRDVGTRGDGTEDEPEYTEMDSRISAIDEPTYVSADNAATDLDASGEGEKPWQVTEHVLDSRHDTDEDLAVDSAENVDQTSADGPHVIWPVDDRLNASRQARFPNPGGFSFEEPVVEHHSEDVDSLLHGARIALTDSHHLRPSRLTPSLTVTLPDPVEVDEEDDLESLSARILPLLTFKAGMFEERLGAVVGAVAGLVILAAGVLFVPRLFSSDDPELIAEASNASSSEHIHAAADPLLAPEASLLSIATFPPGARVYLNAELIGVTPFRDVAVDRGDYQVSIEKNEFAAIDTFLTLDTAKEFFFDLSEEKGLVSLESGEASDHQLLQVADEANAAGRSTRQVSSDRESVANVAVSEPEPRRREVSSRSNSRSSENRRARVEAPSLGALVITSEPMGAVVFIDDEAVGETPATLPELTTGRVRLSLQKDGFVPYETEINVMPLIQTPFHAALAPVKASLFVNASPGGDLYVDDQLVRSGISPGHMELVPVGSRNIKIVHPDYGEYVQVVDVTADNKTTVSVDMVTHGFGWSVENGDRLFAESRYQEAIENYQRALAIRPGAGGLNNKIALAAKAMAESNMPSADVRTSDIDGIYSVTDTAPQLIGGLAALHSYVVYPEEAYNEGIQGRVYVQFVVDEQGRAQDITIAKGLQGGCNEAAIQAVKKARFKPATVGGVPVKARHTLFVNFTI